MRSTTLASIAVLALSTAAIAQVGSAPEEQKIPDNVTAHDDRHAPPNAAADDPEPGTPSTALVNALDDDEPAVGQRPPK